MKIFPENKWDEDTPRMSLADIWKNDLVVLAKILITLLDLTSLQFSVYCIMREIAWEKNYFRNRNAQKKNKWISFGGTLKSSEKSLEQSQEFIIWKNYSQFKTFHYKNQVIKN